MKCLPKTTQYVHKNKLFVKIWPHFPIPLYLLTTRSQKKTFISIWIASWKRWQSRIKGILKHANCVDSSSRSTYYIDVVFVVMTMHCGKTFEFWSKSTAMHCCYVRLKAVVESSVKNNQIWFRIVLHNSTTFYCNQKQVVLNGYKIQLQQTMMYQRAFNGNRRSSSSQASNASRGAGGCDRRVAILVVSLVFAAIVTVVCVLLALRSTSPK